MINDHANFNIDYFHRAIQDDQYVYIGRVKKPAGKNGAFLMHPAEDLVREQVVRLPAIFVEQCYTKVPYRIRNIDIAHTKIVIQCQSIEDKTEAYNLYNAPIYVPKPLETFLVSHSDMHYDVTDYIVKEEDNNILGRVINICKSQSCHMLVVNFQNQELLIPYCKPFVRNINQWQHEITVELPEGYIMTLLS